MMGLVQYEALSYGKPIVSTLIPRSGSPTLNIEGITGFKVPVYDAKALSEKINLVLSDKRLYGKLCDGAVETSLKYNDSDIINRYIDAFKMILA